MASPTWGKEIAHTLGFAFNLSVIQRSGPVFEIKEYTGFMQVCYKAVYVMLV